MSKAITIETETHSPSVVTTRITWRTPRPRSSRAKTLRQMNSRMSANYENMASIAAANTQKLIGRPTF